jgi:hypothetical protein
LLVVSRRDAEDRRSPRNVCDRGRRCQVLPRSETVETKGALAVAASAGDHVSAVHCAWWEADHERNLGASHQLTLWIQHHHRHRTSLAGVTIHAAPANASFKVASAAGHDRTVGGAGPGAASLHVPHSRGQQHHQQRYDHAHKPFCFGRHEQHSSCDSCGRLIRLHRW